ncbi:MBL fold metallo-hydrolase [bacterium]|nr:MBL fold metallo-hydrolase [bacterium]
MKKIFLFIFIFIFIPSFLFLQAEPQEFEEDIIPTHQGDLKINFIGHGTLMFHFGGKVIHVDPVSRYADYSQLPKADLILITHSHGDHLDPDVVKKLRQKETDVVLTEKCAREIKGGLIMENGDTKTVQGIKIEAVPAYNIKHKRSSGVPYHPKGDGNGYILHLGDKRVYVAGDTENTPEMKSLQDIDIAFFPMNLPYTMSPEMAADAAKTIQPDILYPYHYGSTDTSKIVKMLEEEDIEVRIRNMK